MRTTTSSTSGESMTGDQRDPTPSQRPWHASRKHVYVNDLHNRVVAEVIDRPEREANALLLAAAPDLRASLVELLDTIAITDRGWGDGNLTIVQQAIDEKVIARAHAAVAKSLGNLTGLMDDRTDGSLDGIPS